MEGSCAGARIRTWELLREQILSLPPLAARPPRLAEQEGAPLILLPPRSPGGRRPSRRPLRVPRERAPRGRAVSRPIPMAGNAREIATGPGCGERGRMRDRCARAARRAVESEPCAPRSRSASSRGSTARGIPAEAAHCSAYRSAAPARCTGPTARDVPKRPPPRLARTASRSVRARCAASPRTGALAVRRALRGLRSLAYGTVDRRAGDDRAASDAVLAGGRGRHRRRSERGRRNRIRDRGARHVGARRRGRGGGRRN